MSQPALRFSGVAKSFGGTPVLHDVSFEVASGEFFGTDDINGTFNGAVEMAAPCMIVSAVRRLVGTRDLPRQGHGGHRVRCSHQLDR